MSLQKHRQLQVWQKAIRLVEKIYIISSNFPENEKYGLTSQIRRCAVSISANIAEGTGRDSDADFDKFLKIAVGSLYELDSHIEVALLVGYIPESIKDEILEQLDEINRMLYSLRKHLHEKMLKNSAEKQKH